ncbi:hypothetical protein ACXIUH_08915 [Vibrio parahaemolyticus]
MITEVISAIIDYLLTLGIEPYLMIFLSLSVFLSHAVQYLPLSVTEKIPNWVMVLLNILAAKHGAVLSARTDIKGNRIE